MRNIKILLGVLIIFLSGLTIGAIFGGALVKKRLATFIAATPEQRASYGIKVLDKKLTLAAEQESQILTTITEMHRQLNGMRQEARTQYMPAIRSLLTKSIEDVRSKLSAEQSAIFNEYIAEQLRKGGISLEEKV